MSWAWTQQRMNKLDSVCYIIINTWPVQLTKVYSLGLKCPLLVLCYVYINLINSYLKLVMLLDFRKFGKLASGVIFRPDCVGPIAQGPKQTYFTLQLSVMLHEMCLTCLLESTRGLGLLRGCCQAFHCLQYGKRMVFHLGMRLCSSNQQRVGE